MTVVEINNKDSFDELFRPIKSEKVLGQIYVDVGAYDGDTVFKALNINKNLNVVAIEPIKELCDDIKNQLIMHHLEQEVKIAIIDKACWNEKKVINFNEYSGWSKGLSTLRPIMTQIRPEGIFTDKINKYEVQADTLDNILTDNGVGNGVGVDFIKIDTEGSEEQVLKGFTLYHLGTRFHIESHIINLENILLQLLEMGSNIEKIYLSRDGNVRDHVIGTVIGEFIRDGNELLKIPDIDKIDVPSGTDRIKFLIDKAKTCKKILNIGCADNFMFRNRDDLDVMNIDVKDEIPDAYKAKTKFQICDAHNLVGFNDKEFDCAILGDILEHVDDPVQVLKEAKRVGRNVYATVPNEWEWHKDIKPFQNPAHVRFYTYGSLKKDLDKAFGLDNYYIKQYNGGGWSFFCIEYDEEKGKPIIGGSDRDEVDVSRQSAIITKGSLDNTYPILKDRLKIALISSPFFGCPPKGGGYGGLEAVVWDLAEGLDKLGHDVWLFAPEGSKTPSHGKLITTGPILDTVGIDWLQAEKNNYNRYKDIILNGNFDIIDGHDWFGFEYLLKIANPKLKVTHQHHGGLSFDTPAPVLGGKMNLVGISKFMMNYNIQYFKQKGFNVESRYCYNGIDLDFYKFNPDIKRGDKLLYVGRFSSYKGAHFAIELAKRVGIGLDLIGAAKFIDNPDYLKQIESMCNGKDIVIYKDVDNNFKLRKMQEANCLIFPSRMNEPFGLCPVEAMATGCPVVAFDDGAVKEIITPETGFVCKNVDEMVLAIHKINNIKPEDCRKRAEFFSKENMAKNKEKLYRDIISGNEW